MRPDGAILLEMGLATSVAGILCGAAGIALRRYRLAAVARNAIYANAFLVVVATLVLMTAFFEHDFSLLYVAQHSASDLPTFYMVTALWGGHAGSLLFWLALLCLYSTAVAFVHRRDREGMLLPAVHVVLLALQAFFLYVLAYVEGSQPFEPSGGLVPEGAGLNPLLQDPVMAVHPPALYLGFVGMSVPFAFAMGALVSGRLGVQWIRLSRWWTIFGWSFLTLGIILGGFWAFRELGWGGYWAWDSVENSSFLPWLTATAFLHSVIVTEKYRMLKVWNMVLIFLTFALTIFGTFLTRSGFLESVHTFAENKELGETFLWFLAGWFLLWAGLVAVRWSRLRSENRMDSFLSREFAFLANNLVLVALAGIVWTLTVWPSLSGKLEHSFPDLGIRQMTIGPATFSRLTAPFFLLLLLLTGLGTGLSWRATSGGRLFRAFALPLAAGLLVAGAFAWVLPSIVRRPLELGDVQPVAAYGFAALVLWVTGAEFVRGVKARRKAQKEGLFAAAFALYARNHRRYGGYLVHVGTCFVILGITTHWNYQVEVSGVARRGEPLEVAGFALRYGGEHEEFDRENTRVYQATLEIVDLRAPGEPVLGTIGPERLHYTHPDQWMTEVAYHSTHFASSNLYVVLAGFPDRTKVPLQAYFNPLVNLIWGGAAFFLLQAYLLLLPWDRIHRALKARKLGRAERVERRIEEEITRRKRGAG
ncbi:MAG: heme lyase CcmF/NrfE family subunit [Planctomycetes bacterium]|nr:heme lyase CcmF/NrfE family subunit [Planctomycetota bacterium]